MKYQKCTINANDNKSEVEFEQKYNSLLTENKFQDDYITQIEKYIYDYISSVKQKDFQCNAPIEFQEMYCIVNRIVSSLCVDLQSSLSSVSNAAKCIQMCSNHDSDLITCTTILQDDVKHMNLLLSHMFNAFHHTFPLRQLISISHSIRDVASSIENSKRASICYPMENEQIVIVGDLEQTEFILKNVFLFLHEIIDDEGEIIVQTEQENIHSQKGSTIVRFHFFSPFLDLLQKDQYVHQSTMEKFYSTNITFQLLLFLTHCNDCLLTVNKGEHSWNLDLKFPTDCQDVPSCDNGSDASK